MAYEQLLDKALAEMPASVEIRQRFEVPKVRGHIEGNKTVISNFPQIVSALQRPFEQVLKFILKELAAPGVFRNGLLILGSRQSASKVNEKIRRYADEFLLCRECGKPDTKIIHDGDRAYLKCSVCAAKYPVRIAV
jgi:translation initiation factor 2 subunit 2